MPKNKVPMLRPNFFEADYMLLGIQKLHIYAAFDFKTSGTNNYGYRICVTGLTALNNYVIKAQYSVGIA